MIAFPTNYDCSECANPDCPIWQFTRPKPPAYPIRNLALHLLLLGVVATFIGWILGY